MDEQFLLNVYNKYSDKKIDYSDICHIASKIKLILNHIALDEIETYSLMETMLLLSQNNLLDLVDEDLVVLLSKIIGNENGVLYQEDSLQFLEDLRFLMLPHDLNKCISESYLASYLASFDIFLNRIAFLTPEHLLQLNKYNKDLFAVACRCKYLNIKYHDSDILDRLSVLDNMIIDNTLSHLATVLYFNLNEFNYNYDLLVQVFDKVINEYTDFAYICSINGIYKDIISFDSNVQSIINEYVMCKNMLEYEYRTLIKVKK